MSLIDVIDTIDSVLEVLECGLEGCSSPQDGTVVNGDDVVEDKKLRGNNAERCRNLLTMALKIPLSPLSLIHQNQIFQKLLKLNGAIISGRLVISAQSEKVQILILTRRGIARFLKTVAKSVIEVYSPKS